MTAEITKRRLVILGSGFAAVMALKKIDLDRHAVTVVSPRNHFLFTPLLPSTTVGTVEFRSIIEPIRKIRKGIDYIQARCESIDPNQQTVTCKGTGADKEFTLPYDLLVIGIGAVNNTFGVPGVEQHALFLKELSDARAIREAIITCMEKADLPGLDEDERRRLLHFMIVGGGPTGVEFAAELHDLVEEEMENNYPGLSDLVHISLYEALPTLLGAFDKDLRDYTIGHFDRQGIELNFGKQVKEVRDGALVLDDGSTVKGGLILWSTGYSPAPLIESLDWRKEQGRLLTDSMLRIPDHPEIFASGDCATVEGQSYPQTAQLAMQEGKYLGRALNRRARGKDVGEFTFSNLGMLAYIGESEALADIPKAGFHWRGVMTWLLWRSAYMTRLVSFKNKVLVLFDWIKSAVFGRDMSKF